jgi:hypothetical protein
LNVGSEVRFGAIFLRVRFTSWYCTLLVADRCAWPRNALWSVAGCALYAIGFEVRRCTFVESLMHAGAVLAARDGSLLCLFHCVPAFVLPRNVSLVAHAATRRSSDRVRGRARSCLCRLSMCLARSCTSEPCASVFRHCVFSACTRQRYECCCINRLCVCFVVPGLRCVEVRGHCRQRVEAGFAAPRALCGECADSSS